MIIKHNGEFDLAYRFVTETSHNIFLTGKAGTGKTTFLKYVRKNCPKESVVTAPTGVAAINAHGVTLHSLFQLPFGIILPDAPSEFRDKTKIKNHPLLSRLRYNSNKLDLLRRLELLIIDEASMVASYTVDAIDTILRYVRRKPFYPFGGVQVLFIGDLYQLPPVVKKEDCEILQDYYSSVFFFDSRVLRSNIPVIIELNRIYRQKDLAFIEVLNGIRNNNISEENFRILNGRLKRFFMPGENEEYITLTTHNSQADEINQQRLRNIPGRIHSYQAEIIDEFPENSYPADRDLKLKVGAQVMFLKNDVESKKFFNGKIGTVTGLNEDGIRVKCKDDYNEIKVQRSEWQNIRYKANPDTREITEEVLGSFVQYPLRLAWAITIHKSQGLTFDKVIIDAERAFAKGQVYVALSRCRSLEGLILKTPVSTEFLGAHKDFNNWLKDNMNNMSPDVFAESRNNFILQEIQDIFTWKDWYDELMNLKEFLEENLKETNVEPIKWLTELILMQNEMNRVSEIFKEKITVLNKKNSPAEKNEVLQNRIKDGANYFFGEITEWNEKFINHPLAFGTKRLAGQADELLTGISNIVEEILMKIDMCKNGFILDDYLKNRNSIKINIKRPRSTFSKSLKKNTVEESVKLLRLVKNIKMVSKLRNLTEGTIETHIAKAIKQDLIRIEEVIPLEEARKIAKYFPAKTEEIRLTPIKEMVPEEISYGKLRIVLAWLQKENNG